MRVEIEGRSYFIQFKHLEMPMCTAVDLLIKSPRKVTACQILSADSREKLVEGRAICRPTDQYDRERGRKLALGRALHKLFPGWEGLPSRREVWTAYLGRPRPKSQPRSLKEVVDAAAVG